MSAVPDFETLALTQSDYIATVQLDRAGKANAMNATMWRELEQCFDWLDSESSVRVVVLAAKGEHFCAGIDLELFSELNAAMQKLDAARRAEYLRREILTLQRNLSAIERCRKPVLAAIHSTCIGAGLDMVSCCDMRYCSADAVFSIKEIDLGMTADVGTLQRLPKILRDGMVREMAYTGRSVSASEAGSIGLVNRVFADKPSLMEGVQDIARQIAEKSPLAIRGTKEMLLYSRDHSVQDGLNYIATWNGGMLSVDDIMRSVAARSQGKTADFED